jgi:hypothetical protein
MQFGSFLSASSARTQTVLMTEANDKAMKYFFLIVCLAVLLSACQNGSAPTTPPGETPNTPTDTTAPTLVSQTPTPNAEGVATNPSISATFSEAMSASSVTTESVKVVDDSGTSLERTATLNNETLTVQLTTPPNVPAKLTLELNGLTDVAGNPLEPTSWSWFVPASAYGDPVFLGEPSAITDARLEERPAQIASDENGNIAVVWLNGGNLLVKTWNGTTWQQLGGPFDAPQPIYGLSIKLSNGQPVVAYQEGRKLSDDQPNPNGNIIVQRWTGSQWESLGNVGVLERDTAAPSLAVAEDGTVIVAYFEFDGFSSNVIVKRWDGATWQSLGEALDSDLSSNAVFPSLALDPEGNPVVAWYEDRAEDLARNIYVKRWNGTVWEQLGTSLNNNERERADTLSLAIGGNGQPVVAFSEFDQEVGSNNVYVKRWTGITWEQLGDTADNVKTQRAVYPSVAVDVANQISVAWYEAVCRSVNPCNENDSVYLTRWDGTTWQQLGIQDSDARREAYFPSLAIGASGAPVLAWIEGKTTQYQVLVKEYRSSE